MSSKANDLQLTSSDHDIEREAVESVFLAGVFAAEPESGHYGGT